MPKEKLNPLYWLQRLSDWEHGTNYAEDYGWRSDEGLKRSENKEKEWRKFQVNANEHHARQLKNLVFNDFLSQGIYPWRIDAYPGDKGTQWNPYLNQYVESWKMQIPTEHMWEMIPALEAHRGGLLSLV